MGRFFSGLSIEKNTLRECGENKREIGLEKFLCPQKKSSICFEVYLYTAEVLQVKSILTTKAIVLIFRSIMRRILLLLCLANLNLVLPEKISTLQQLIKMAENQARKRTQRQDIIINSKKSNSMHPNLEGFENCSFRINQIWS